MPEATRPAPIDRRALAAVYGELQELFAECAAAADDADSDLFASCFAADGVVNVPEDGILARYAGRDAIRRWRERTPRSPRRRHVLSNLRVLGSTGSQMRCVQSVVVFAVTPPARILTTAQYEDVVRRGAGGQLEIVERHVVLDR